MVCVVLWRKWEKREMEGKSSKTTVEITDESSENNIHDVNFVAEEEEEEVILKKSISSHALFGLLIQTHLNCLTVRISLLTDLFFSFLFLHSVLFYIYIK